ncbi:MAG: hypothetical protein Q9173_000871 [Seirophora scorigena]
MAGITNTTTAVKAVFSLNVITAVVGFLLFGFGIVIVTIRVKNGRITSISLKRSSSDTDPLKTTLATHICLVVALFCFSIAYAMQTAIVALQVRSESPVSVTAAFSYYYTDGSSPESSNSNSISILSFAQGFVTILFTFFLTAAVWLHSNNLTTNGTRVNTPGTLSRLWNALILGGILLSGFASWARGMYVRKHTDLTFPNAINGDRVARILYILFRCVVIFSSTSVSIEVLRLFSLLKEKGSRDNTSRPLLARFVYAVVPIIWIRNAFILVNIVLIYQDVAAWSRPASQAVTFLLIIFGQLANLTILVMVLWGAWSMGRTAGKGREDDELISGVERAQVDSSN